MKEKPLGRISFLTSVLKGVRRWFVIAIITSLISVGMSFIAPQIIRIIIDSVLGDAPLSGPVGGILSRVTTREVLREHLLGCALIGMCGTFLSAAFSAIYRYSINLFGEGAVKTLRNRLYTHIIHLPYAWHVKSATGDILQRCTQDVNTIRMFLCNQLIQVIRVFFLMGLSLGIMFSMNVPMSFVALIFIPVILGYTLIFYGQISRRFQDADEAEGRLTTVVQENATGVRVVRAFGREAYELDKFDDRINHYTSLWIRLGRVLGVYWTFGDVVTSIQVMTMILFGVLQCVNHGMTVGVFVAFMTYNQMMIWPVRELGRILSDMSKSGVSVRRVREILNEQREDELPCENLKPEITGDIEFRRVTFGYEETPVLSDVSFHIFPGQKIGILGATGSGKSTIAHLLNRLYDVPEGQGEILIDGIDIRRIDRGWLRQHINVVLQDTFLFSRTIRENIAAAFPEAELSQIRHVAAVASVDTAIMGFGQQYETLVGERGVTLSGGQKQRVAIARALMTHAPVMIFDDSLSAVDTQTDAAIRQALNENKSGTTIYIAHRVTTLMDADRIFVVAGGQIVQQGTHETLMEEPGIYQEVYNLQAGAAAEVAALEARLFAEEKAASGRDAAEKAAGGDTDA